MNIFAVHSNPKIAAQMLANQHVNKMILENAQMFSFVADRYGYPALYSVKGSHRHHPATLWVGNRRANWLWLIEHSFALWKEKLYRTGKTHKSIEVIRWYQENDYGPPADGLPLEPFVLCMPERYRQENRVQAYRDFYVGDKQFFKNGTRPKWTRRSPPDWWEYR